MHVPLHTGRDHDFQSFCGRSDGKCIFTVVLPRDKTCGDVSFGWLNWLLGADRIMGVVRCMESWGRYFYLANDENLRL